MADIEQGATSVEHSMAEIAQNETGVSQRTAGMEREMGGYFELERFGGAEYHEGAIALDCGRNCLAYLIEARNIKTIWTPWYLCDSVDDTCAKYGVTVHHYDLTENFEPNYDELSELGKGDYLYLVDYYGQLSDEAILSAAKACNGRLIVDEVMAFYRKPVSAAFDTLYSCRKFFGVADGAYLYTNAKLERELPHDQSHERMDFVLARCELPCNDYYAKCSANNKHFIGETIKQMSPITHNLLRGIDYAACAKRREENFTYLAERLGSLNQLELTVPEGSFMYPFMVEGGAQVRRKLQAQKIYVTSMFWSREDRAQGRSKRFIQDIVPLICDHRYTLDDMAYQVDKTLEALS